MVLYGGAGSGKSVAAAQKILGRCYQRAGHRFLNIRKVARTIRHSSFQLLRDLASEYNFDVKVNRSDMSLHFDNGSEIISAGLDDTEKLKSIAGITGVWIEEATDLTEDDFVQVDLRLRGWCPDYRQILMTFNPIWYLHWLKRRFIDEAFPDSLVIHSTWNDNAFLSDEYVRVLEGLSGMSAQIYGRGEWGQITEGLIYPEWSSAPYPEESSGEEVYGLDFGYNNPTVLVQIRMNEDDKSAHCRQVIWQTRATNDDLIRLLEVEGVSRETPIYADSAEPQRIEEIYRAGYNVHPSDKSVNDGIDTVKQFRLYIDPKAVDLQAEIRGYEWAQDKEGNRLDKPVKFRDHGMDAIRYALHTHTKDRVSWWIS